MMNFYIFAALGAKRAALDRAAVLWYTDFVRIKSGR
jgi:hypothetical protein